MSLPFARYFCQKFTNGSVHFVPRSVYKGHVRLVQHGASHAEQQQEQPTSESSQQEEAIVIPKRKKRDKLSVLRALASTVQRDFNAPHYKYLDDPYTIPASTLEKWSFSLAKASGQKAARYVSRTYPKLFEEDLSEPKIEAYCPPTGPRLAEDSVAGIEERLNLRLPMDAYNSHTRCQESGVEVPTEVVSDLLELLCFYNSENPADPLLADEQFYRRYIQPDLGQKKIRKTWKDQGPAEMLFRDMDTKSTRAYSAVIRGRAKYFQIDKAYELFREMKSLKLPVDVETYNAVLGIVSFVKERGEDRWALAKGLLGEMASEGVAPTLDTFNTLLYLLQRNNKRLPNVHQLTMQTINEMQLLGIEPSLLSWLYVVRILQEEPSDCSVLHQIISHLEGTEFELNHPDDLEFFSTAMIVNFHYVQDLDLAYRIDELLNLGGNLRFIGDGYKEGLYYTHFMRLLCMFEQIDNIMQHYERITPHCYTPTFTALDELLTAIELNDGYHYLPKIWSDLVLYDYIRRADLLEKLLQIMAKEKQEAELQGMFQHVAIQVQDRFQKDAQNRRLSRPLQLSGSMIGNMSHIHLAADDYESAWEIFELYVQKKNTISGYPSEKSLVALVDACVARNDTEKAIQAVSIMGDVAYPSLDAAVDKLKSALTLTEQQKMHLDDLL